jgi:hypothetical protein
MLLPENIYKRIPQFWLLIGLLFLFLGLTGGNELAFLPAYVMFGLFAIMRGIWIYQSRWKFHRRNKVAILRSTQIIKHEDLQR